MNPDRIRKNRFEKCLIKTRCSEVCAGGAAFFPEAEKGGGGLNNFSNHVELDLTFVCLIFLESFCFYCKMSSCW